MVYIKDQYLLIKGIAGLGDRLHVLSQAIEYAKISHRTCLIDWSDGVYCEPGVNIFHKYFKIKDVDLVYDTLEIQNFENLKYRPAAFSNFPLGNIYDHYVMIHPPIISQFPIMLIPKGNLRNIYGFWVPKKFKKNNFKTYLNIFSNSNIIQGRNLKTNLKEDVVIYADMGSDSKKEIFLKHIDITDSINEKIVHFALQNDLSDNCLGIHIRATDINYTAKIPKIIEYITNHFPNYRIFIATDNSMVEELFRAHFSNVISFEKYLPNVTTGGIHHQAYNNKDWSHSELILEQSIFDMWLLAKCEWLFYIESSSFSKISSYLHKNPNKQINIDEI